jgi:hypothetical protein
MVYAVLLGIVGLQKEGSIQVGFRREIHYLELEGFKP